MMSGILATVGMEEIFSGNLYSVAIVILPRIASGFLTTKETIKDEKARCYLSGDRGGECFFWFTETC